MCALHEPPWWYGSPIGCLLCDLYIHLTLLLSQGAPSAASAPYLPQSQRQELVASAARTAAQTLKLQGTSAPHIAGLGEGCDSLGWDQAMQLKVRSVSHHIDPSLSSHDVRHVNPDGSHTRLGPGTTAQGTCIA
jgi:hypothetical protein